MRACVCVCVTVCVCVCVSTILKFSPIQVSFQLFYLFYFYTCCPITNETSLKYCNTTRTESFSRKTIIVEIAKLSYTTPSLGDVSVKLEL